MKLKILIALGIVALFGWRAEAQIYDTNDDYVQTLAGSGFTGYVDGVGQLTMFSGLGPLVVNSHGDIFAWDAGNHKIRKVSQDGTVTTFAGTNNTLAFDQIGGMCIDSNDTIWIAANTSLYQITSNAEISFVSSGQVYPIEGICADSSGNIYYSAHYRIYKYISNNNSTVFAGSGNIGYVDGNGIFTSFNIPKSLAADRADNIYVWDSYNSLVRKIDQMQNVTTFAGSYAMNYGNQTNLDGVGTNVVFKSIGQMVVDDSGSLILACSSCVRKISAATNVVTLAGSFTQTGYTNGAGNNALFLGADGVCVANGQVFVADSTRIRSITNNPVPQIVSSPNLGIGTFAGVTITGTVGRTYQIQSSPDFNAWTTRVTILLNASPYLWIDLNPVAGNKFYRAYLLP